MTRNTPLSKVCTSLVPIIPLVVLLLLFSILASEPVAAFSAVPTNQGLEIRVCQDRDCITDGAKQANEIVSTLVQKGSSKIPVTVNKCGCLGPCGKGPNVDVRIDGIRVKDNRPGQSNYYVFREIDSVEAAAKMLDIAGMDIPAKAVQQLEQSSTTPKVESTRTFWDFDRTTRIALQRLLYVSVGLPLVDAQENGTWDVINGQVYENSYFAIAAAVFIGSQFMGTSSTANNVVVDED